MKSNAIFAVCAFAAAVLVSYMISCVSSRTIYTIDSQKISQAYEKTAGFEGKLKKFAADSNAEADKLNPELTKLADSLKAFDAKIKAAKTAAEKDKLVAEAKPVAEKYNNLAAAKRKYVAEANRKIANFKLAAAREIQSDIDKACAKFAEKSKVDYILDSQRMRFCGSADDISDKILKILNENFEKTQK